MGTLSTIETFIRRKDTFHKESVLNREDILEKTTTEDPILEQTAPRPQYVSNGLL